MQNHDVCMATHKVNQNYSVWKRSTFWSEKTAGLTIVVFLEKLRKFKVCGNRFRIVYYDNEKKYEPE